MAAVKKTAQNEYVHVLVEWCGEGGILCPVLASRWLSE